MATRYPGEHKTVSVERSFCEKGQPTIHMSGGTFIYSDGTPVTQAEHVEELPEPFRTQALEFVEGTEPGGRSSVAPEGSGRARSRRRPKEA